MAKGSYNISVSGNSKVEKEGCYKNNNEVELENQECMRSCLKSGFLRSLSLHDRPRSSRVPTNKELHKSRYKALVSTSLEKIPSNILPSSERRFEYLHDSVRNIAETEVTTWESIHNASSSVTRQQTDQNQLSGNGNLLEDKYSRLSLKSKTLLQRTVAILKEVDKDISESFTDLTRSESIALESVMEVYKNKGKRNAGSSDISEFNLSVKPSNQPDCHKWKLPHSSPKEGEAISAAQGPKHLQVQSHTPNSKYIRSTSAQKSSDIFLEEASADHIYENWLPVFHQKAKVEHVHSTPRRPKELQDHSSGQSINCLQAQSVQQSPENLNEQNLKSLQAQKSPKNVLVQQSSKNLLAQQSPKHLQTHSSGQSSKKLNVNSIHQNRENSPTELSAHDIYENSLPAAHQNPNDEQVHSTLLGPKDCQVRSPGQSPKDLCADSTEQSHENFPIELSVNDIYENWQPTVHQIPKDEHVHSTPRGRDDLLACSPEQIRNSFQAHSAPQIPKDLLVLSAQQTLKNLQALRSNSGNTAGTNSDSPRSVEQNPINLPRSLEVTVLDDTTEVKSLIDFDLPTDHESFVEIVGALQNRCLEYREMIQDIAVSAMEEWLNFSEFSITQIRLLRKQFESLKKNFKDFKDLCHKSVVFGPDSMPIDEKVKEVIQSFYLKLLQEENETFIARLAFGLEMSDVYADQLKFEVESKKIITTLENEILYIKKTSIGFRV